MACSYLYPTQLDTQSTGELEVTLTTQAGLRPIPNATVQISTVDDPTHIIEELHTDEGGNTPVIDLPTPPAEYSSEPDGPQPYSGRRGRNTAFCNSAEYPLWRLSAKNRRSGSQTDGRKRRNCFKPGRHSGIYCRP